MAKKEPDKYLKYLNQEVEILTHRNAIIQGKFVDWDNKEIMIEKRVYDNPEVHSKTTHIPRYTIKEIKILGLSNIKSEEIAQPEPQESQIPQEKMTNEVKNGNI